MLCVSAHTCAGVCVCMGWCVHQCLLCCKYAGTCAHIYYAVHVPGYAHIKVHLHVLACIPMSTMLCVYQCMCLHVPAPVLVSTTLCMYTCMCQCRCLRMLVHIACTCQNAYSAVCVLACVMCASVYYAVHEHTDIPAHGFSAHVFPCAEGLQCCACAS